MKILVIGFQRGGTTLLRRLIHNHPDIQHMLHEKRILNLVERRQQVILNGLGIDKNENWGEKVPWNSGDGKVIIKYGDKWLEKFGPDARIVHIVRHPVDSGLSNQRLGWMRLDEAIDKAYKSIPLVIRSFKHDKRYMPISFEALVINPNKVLKSIFKFCGLRNDDETVSKISGLKKDKLRYYDGIQSNKAFAYRKVKRLNCKIPDYNEILRIIDELSNA